MAEDLTQWIEQACKSIEYGTVSIEIKVKDMKNVHEIRTVSESIQPGNVQA